MCRCQRSHIGRDRSLSRIETNLLHIEHLTVCISFTMVDQKDRSDSVRTAVDLRRNRHAAGSKTE